MSRTGACWDNSAAENWFSHFKTEFYYHRRFAAHREAAIMGYIESWYDRRRPNERADGFARCTPGTITKPATKNSWLHNQKTNQHNLSQKVDERRTIDFL